MILEIAQIDVKPGVEQEFEAAVKTAVALFKDAKGAQSFELCRSAEKPQRYRVLIEWEALEDSTVGFQQSPGLQQWRNLVGHFFAGPPSVEHVHRVLKGF